MELDQLRTLLAVTEHGTIGGAARALYLSQSAASRQLAALERDLKVSLLVRERDGVRLTPAGQVIARAASEVLQIVEAARREVAIELPPPGGNTRDVVGARVSPGNVRHC